MPDSIRDMANSLLKDPVLVEVAPVGTTVELVEQRLCFVRKSDKQRLLVHLIGQNKGQRVLVFSRTKHGADRIAKNLVRDGIQADAIHGNKSQGARQRALNNFRDGAIPVLIATDIAARGIDVKDIGLVVNFDLPEEPEAYVHRIGRTARAGASGLAIAFCDTEERSLLRDIQRLIRMTIPIMKDHPFVDEGNDMPSRQGGFQPRSQNGGQQRSFSSGPQGQHHHQAANRRPNNRGDGRARATTQRQPQDSQSDGARGGSDTTAASPRAKSPLQRFAFWRR
jgi:ATP-dependent RNA helicase RhlE